MAGPNILVTGTPGTGKTTTAELVAIATDLTHIEIGNIIKLHNLHDGLDTKFNSLILNEDKLLDHLEPIMQNRQIVTDYHGCDFFPERWFDLIVVLQTDHSILYPRLESRNYNQEKINENIECEIMQVCLQEAFDSYEHEKIIVLQSDSVEQMDQNVERISQWVIDFNNANQ